VADRMGVDAVVADCGRYWSETRVPQARVEEMKIELESHLREAQLAGKSPEAVVGPDLAAFAESWAAELRAPAAPGAWQNRDRKARVRRERWSAYGWMLGLAVVVTILIAVGPKEETVNDIETWRWVWLGAAVILGIGEMITAGLFMLPFAIGAVAATVLAFFDVAVWLQLVVFLVTSVAALWGMRRFAWRDKEPQYPVGAKRYAGAVATVTEVVDRVGGTGRVRLETEQWRATTDLDEPIAAGTEVKVVDVRGARLVVEPRGTSE
jgi:membrane protein implicated in regulation of membrane protease activity